MEKQNSKPRYKVCRLIDKYDLTGIGEELEERWIRQEDRRGLRQLAGYFNRRLMRAALTQNNIEPLDGEVDNFYRLLTDEDISSGVRTETRNKLDQHGIDVDELKQDFVSYQSIYSYLVKYRDIQPPDKTSSEEDQRGRKLETIQRLKTRLIAVTERSLTELTNGSHLTLGDFNVLVTIRVHCTECDTHRPVADLLTNGGCECSSSDQS